MRGLALWLVWNVPMPDLMASRLFGFALNANFKKVEA